MNNKDTQTYIRHDQHIMDYKDFWMGNFGIYLSSGGDGRSTYVSINNAPNKQQDIVTLTSSVNVHKDEYLEIANRKINYLTLIP